MNTKFTFSKMTDEDAREVLGWKYTAPFDVYNRDLEDVGRLVEPTNLYLTVRDGDGAIVAYYCFGGQAQIAGGDYNEIALDIAGQARPDLLGSGFGEMFVRVAVDFGKMFFNPQKFRTTVPISNKRALKVCERAGFVIAGIFVSDEGNEFCILTKAVEPDE
ncbi:MAG TPA: GNAT family protein [Pyrinomonadaceae bacterium]|nr:GNAT family protein [Pyrinomonadaceae bacterium]